MSTQNSFILYKCDTCNRTTEIKSDGIRPDPTRCNITYKCRGKLQRVGQSSIKKFLFTPPVEGLQDYIPRGSKTASVIETSEDSRVSIFSGGNGSLAIAALKFASGIYSVISKTGSEIQIPIEDLSDIKLKLTLFKISPSLLEYKKYTYHVAGNLQVVQGMDDSADSKNLRFTSSNEIRVFVNGIEMSSTSYDRSVNDIITFTPAIFETNNVVDILVYTDISAVASVSEKVDVEFRHLTPTVDEDRSFLINNCWGDVRRISVYGDEKALLFCTNTSVFVKDFRYGFHSASLSLSGVNYQLSTSELLFLIGKPPYTAYDRELYAYLNCEKLEDTILEYSQDINTGLIELSVSESDITQITRALIPTQKAELILEESTEIVSQTNFKHQYILGPV